MRKLLILASVLVVFTAGFAVACGGDDDDSGASRSVAGPDTGSSGGDYYAPSTAGSTSSAPAAAGVQEIQLKAGESGQAYFMNPKEVKLKPGQVKVTMSNDGPERPHNFVVRNLNGQGDLVTSERLNPGQTGSITFAVVAGTYQFLCTLPGHADRGAQGTFVVAN